MARILIVDDEPDLRAVMRTFLEGDDHEVIEAADGREGRSRIEDSDLDLVITDIVMPGQGGMELTMELSMRHPDLRWILISGQVPVYAPPVQSLVNRFGIESILSKPFTKRQFLAAVHAALAGERRR